MTAFRSISALVLALLMASPLCCCVAEAAGPAPVKQAAKCCGGQEAPVSGADGLDGVDRQQRPQMCACKVKEPREAGTVLVLPTEPFGSFAPRIILLEPRPRTAEQAAPVGPWSEPCAPPRLLLARYARWLI